jgi:hypothetical protein
MPFSRIANGADLRRHRRYPIEGGRLRLLWDDGKRERVLNGKVLDVSVSGARLLLEEPLPPRALVLCSDVKLGIHGTASVRYCNPVKRKYEIGIEFAGGSGWHEPEKSLEPSSPTTADGAKASK